MTLILSSCSSSKSNNTTATSSQSVVDNSRDGSSYEKAVIIKANSEMTGVGEVYKALGKMYPGYKLVSQSTGSNGSKKYDVMKIVTSSGENKTVYFDITSFYGKF